MKMLLDYFPDAEYDFNQEDDFYVIINGKSYPYEMTLSPTVPDEACCRVKIDDEYLYFGHL